MIYNNLYIELNVLYKKNDKK